MIPIHMLLVFKTQNIASAGAGFALPVGLMLFCAHAVMAQTVAQVTAALATDVAPAKLESLILSPIQRQNLEFVRRTGAGDAERRLAEDLLLDTGSGGAAVSSQRVISGVVIRSGNRSTVWVNNQPVYGQSGGSALRSLAGQVGVVTQESGNMSIKSKPGRIVDVPTQQSVDLLPPGAIVINRPKVGEASSTVKEIK